MSTHPDEPNLPQYSLLCIERSEPHKLIHCGLRSTRGCRHIERQGAHLTRHCHDFAALESLKLGSNACITRTGAMLLMLNASAHPSKSIANVVC